MEDNNIVQLYFKRDENAIAITSEKYGAKLRRISYNITLDHQTSEECENDTYLEAWKRIPPAEPKDYLFAFLIRIIRHISIDVCRKKCALKRDAYIVSLSEELENCIPAMNGVEDMLYEKYTGKLISEFLHTISQEKRVMFMRRYFYLDSISDIAKRMNISESKVKTTIFRVRNNLRVYLEKEGFSL